MDNHIVCTTHQGFGLSVLIPIIENDVELLVRTCHQIWAHINPPQTGTIHLVAFMEVEVGCVAGGSDITAVITALDDEFHLLVAIDIGYSTVVQCVAAECLTITVDNSLYRDLPVLMLPWCAGRG